jgi:hypothetical protein
MVTSITIYNYLFQIENRKLVLFLETYNISIHALFTVIWILFLFFGES